MKKKLRGIVNLLIMVVFCFTLASCGGGGGGGGSSDATLAGDGDGGGTDGGTDKEAELKYIKFDLESSSISIIVGLTYHISVSGVFDDDTVKDFTDIVEWSSSDTDILEITADGIVHGNKVGAVLLSVRYKTYPVIYVSVTIGEKSVTSLKISPRPAVEGEKIAISQSFDTHFTAKATYNNNTEEVLDNNVIWTAEDPSGKSLINRFTGVFKPYDSTSDNVTIRAEYSGFSDEITGYIESLTLQSIELKLYKDSIPGEDDHPTSLEIVEGTSAHVMAVATYDLGAGKTVTRDISNSVTWTTDNSGDAKISQDGTIYNTSTVGASTSITIDIEDLGRINPSPVTLTINQKELTEIRFAQTLSNAAVNTVFQLTATAYYNNDTTEELSKSQSNSVWESSDLAILKVNSSDQRGLVEAQSIAGEATITVKKCKDGGDGCYADESSYLTASTTVTVHDLTPTSIEIHKTGISKDILGTGSIAVDLTSSIPNGLTTYLTIIGKYEDDQVQEMNLTLDPNVALYITGSSLKLCLNHDEAGRTEQCWVKVESDDASGDISAEYLPTGLVSDSEGGLSIAGTSRALLAFDIAEGTSPNIVVREEVSLQKGKTMTLWLYQQYSDGSSDTSAIDSNSGVTWTFSSDGVTFDATNDIVTISSDGTLTGISTGNIVAKASIEGYSGTLTEKIFIQVFPDVITLGEPFNGTIDSNKELNLEFDFPEAGEYLITFVSQEKTNLHSSNPGYTWFFIGSSFDCLLGHDKTRVSTSFSAGIQEFGFDNLEPPESSETTIFSLTITKGGGYACE